MTAFWWALFAAFVWGIVPIIEKVGLGKVEPLVGLFYRCLGVVLGIILLGLFIVKPQELKSIDPRSVALLVLGGFLASFVAQIAFYHALKLGEVSRVTPIAGIYFVVAFICGVIFMREQITLTKFFGVVLMMAGLFLLK